MGKELNKIKLLFLHDIFTRQTDKDHVYSANELCDLLSEYGINCERKSIYSDIDALKKVIEGKKALEELQKTHILLNEG